MFTISEALELVALVGGLVHSMVPGEAPRVATLLIEDGRIQQIAPEIELQPGTRRLDVTGMHVVPGLIDGMVHFDRDHDPLYVSAGVTAVRDMGSERVRALLERRPEARDRAPGPSLYTAGALIDGDPPASPEAVVVRDANGADAFLPILLSDEVDFFSVHLGLSAEAHLRTVEIAHENQLQVWGPVPRGLDLSGALAAGQDGIVYLDSFLPAEVPWPLVNLEDVVPMVQELLASGARLVPMLHAASSRLRDQSDETDVLGLLAPSYDSWWRADLSARIPALDGSRQQAGAVMVAKQQALLAKLYEAGVPLVPGSGSPHPWLLPGYALHQELAQWVQAGIPPHEVLRLGTRGTAEALGVADERGALFPGAIADVLVTREDPREGIATLNQPELVVLRGRVFERRDLDDLLESLGQRQLALRTKLAEPLEVAAPPTPEGALVLEGKVISSALGNQVSVERFRVIQEPDGRVAFSGRIAYPDGHELTVVQHVRNGKLEEFRITSSEGAEEVTCDGLWTAESLRMQRRLDQMYLGNQSTRERAACVDVASVTSLFVLGQRALGEDFPVVTFHEMLEPEVAHWGMDLDDAGNHQLRTHLGRMAFRFDENGAPILWRTAVGQSVIDTVLVEADAFGGAGYPLPTELRARIDLLQAAQAAPAGEETPEDE